ncbi:hypothetical protein SAMN06265222_109103 [Neorhodopirellula lusitana]|uniref:Uncharacterized protein n=1 Tax=Neorhodopirellula lusitana TaxID=445327 RepID=A0ABY1QAF9_9BACT|nr:hypothetical protein SAMN06265222_109103 [Neorhodopirellula lusitana]
MGTGSFPLKKFNLVHRWPTPEYSLGIRNGICFGRPTLYGVCSTEAVILKALASFCDTRSQCHIIRRPSSYSAAPPIPLDQQVDASINAPPPSISEPESSVPYLLAIHAKATRHICGDNSDGKEGSGDGCSQRHKCSRHCPS